MVKIWAKIMNGDKVKKDIIYEAVGNFHANELYLHLQNICHRLDIPCPVVLKAHEYNFMAFNNCVFAPRDFVESISFSKLIIENVKE